MNTAATFLDLGVEAPSKNGYEQEVAGYESEEETQQSHERGRGISDLVGSLLLARVNWRYKVRRAAKTLQDPQLAQNLVDFAHPEKWSEARQAQRLVMTLEREKGSYHLNHEQVLRRRYATILARRLHKRVGKVADEIRIKAAATRFGIDEAELRTRLADWQKVNPGQPLETGLLISSEQLHREAVTQNGGKTDETKIEGNKKELQKDFDSAYNEAIEAIEKDPKLAQEKEKLERGKKKVEEILNNPSSKVPLSDSGHDQAQFLKEQNSYIETGQQAIPTLATPSIPTTTPTIVSPPSPTMASTTPIAGPVLPTTPTPTVPAPIPTPAPLPMPSFTKMPSPPSLLNNARAGITNSVAQINSQVASLLNPLTSALGNIKSALGDKIGSFFNRGLGGALKQGAGKLVNGMNLAMTAGKQLLNRGLDALLPGLGVAAGRINEAIKRATGIDIEATLIKGVVFLLLVTVGLIVGLAIIFILFLVKGIPGSGSQNAMEFPINNNTGRAGWEEFEKAYLVIQPTIDQTKTISWQQFEKENLTPLEKVLSLEPAQALSDVKKKN